MNTIRLPEYLSHLTVNENVIVVDSARDKALVIDYLQACKAKYSVTQVTISRCEIHVKRTS